jgi:hypothetical protein
MNGKLSRYLHRKRGLLDMAFVSLSLVLCFYMHLRIVLILKRLQPSYGSDMRHGQTHSASGS